MKKTLFIILISTILITACASAAPTATLPAPAASTKAPAVSQPTSAPLVGTIVPPQPAAVQPTKPISKEFTPSDPKNVKLAAGKPQLVEFFAFW
jgi:hypothetical protein